MAPDALDFLYRCPSCGAAGRMKAIPAASAPEPACGSCGRPLPFARRDAVRPGAAVTVCAVCGDDKLYIQKDFNQKVGCLVVAAGAAFVPWTYGLSLAVCAAADWALYRLLPMITVCYVCGTRWRRLPLNPDHRPFDLMTAQTWEARSLTWRRLNDRSEGRRTPLPH